MIDVVMFKKVILKGNYRKILIFNQMEKYIEDNKEYNWKKENLIEELVKNFKNKYYEIIKSKLSLILISSLLSDNSFITSESYGMNLIYSTFDIKDILMSMEL